MDERAVLGRLREEARALAAAGPDKTQAALVAYTVVEDEASNILDRCTRDEEAKVYFTKQYREIIAESNEFVGSVFTPHYIGKTPWTDLLTSDHNWQQYGLQAFRVGNGRLEVVGPATGACANGLIACPATGGYRDFEMEMEFTLEGAVDLYFRLGRRVDYTVEHCALSTNCGESLNPSQTYTIHVSFIGDKLRGTLTPEAFSFPDADSDWTKSRKGAIAAQIHEGAKFSITRLRIRVLREA
jgi:hypothetical protein